MGPILYFRGRQGVLWHLSATLLQEHAAEPEPLRIPGAEPVRPTLLMRHGVHHLWRYDFAVSLQDAASAVDYTIGVRQWRVDLPAPDGGLRIAFTACNGDESDTFSGWPMSRNARWEHLEAEHRRTPFHLLLQGGDQLYADTVWRVPQLAEWQRLPRRRRREAAFTPETAAAVFDHYVSRYRWLWSQPEVARVMATIPSLMMWDDHDIFDGWGSHPVEDQACPVYQGVWAAARETFALFQLGARPEDLPDGFADRRGGHFGWAYRLGDIGIIAPDLRSHRTRYRVMGDAGWQDFVRCLDTLSGCRHVVLLSSVPLINADLSFIEKPLMLIPGDHPFQDDLRDQWQSYAHRREWLRLLRHLAAVSRREGTRVTAVSGEIHLGCLGVIEAGSASIFQLTSSGIVHPPPAKVMVRLFEWASRGRTRLGDDLIMKILPLPGANRRYLAARNWLSLDIPPAGDLRAVWHGEGEGNRIAFTIPAQPAISAA